MRKLAFVVIVLLWTAKPAEATFIYTYDAPCGSSGCGGIGGLSFSILSESVTGIGQTFVGHPNLVSLTPPTNCQSFTQFTVVSYQRFPTEGERIVGFGLCNSALWGVLTVFDELFDHVGTYTQGTVTLTIAEVPEPATWLLSGLGLALLRLRRARH
jgi:hypothetical protein